ncbi:hypothetical protein PoB_002767900 [Plakobranchus ocellatus]|uniref:Uncharacterized protein n=1 Tax=Plakobranchus ocellatus TaxID=259542 RepID=A0AAV4A0P8_9GAST|nr:hypothetical protein PoB_002767900 [Plakobranchus ocellatus]
MWCIKKTASPPLRAEQVKRKLKTATKSKEHLRKGEADSLKERGDTLETEVGKQGKQEEGGDTEKTNDGGLQREADIKPEDITQREVDIKPEDTMPRKAEIKPEDTMPREADVVKPEDTLQREADFKSEDTLQREADFKSEDTLQREGDIKLEDTTQREVDVKQEDTMQRESQWKMEVWKLSSLSQSSINAINLGMRDMELQEGMLCT